MRLRALAILPCALWLSGCFVLDEFEKGDALIEQHSVGWREKKKRDSAAAAAAEAETASKPQSGSWKFWKKQEKDPTLREHLGDWWRKALEEPKATAKSDPDDGIVRCTIGDQIVFTRQSDCIARRGRFEPRPGKADPPPAS